MNLTLGGIDLNNSGRYVLALFDSFFCALLIFPCLRVVSFCSVVVREDKKLLTVLFPDGRDGRAFTLKVCLDA